MTARKRARLEELAESSCNALQSRSEPATKRFRGDAGKPKTNAAPNRASILTLPVEMLHSIFEILEQLDVASVLDARLTCRAFASVGIDYMPREVYAVFKRDSLKRLVDIAAHERFSKRVDAFYFQADRFSEPALDYKKWDNVRGDARAIIDFNLMDDIADDNARHLDEEEILANHQTYRIMKRGQHSQAELKRAYAAYREAVKDQRRIVKSHFDRTCLKRFFQSCQGIQDVTVSVGHDFGSSRHGLAFEEAMTHPWGDINVLDQGVYQFWIVIEALHQSNLRPKRFTATDISYRSIRPVWHGLRVEPLMRHLMSGLHEFRLSHRVNGEAYEFNCLPQSDVAAEADECNRSGLMAKWLSWATELRVLKLKLQRDMVFLPETTVGDVFGKTTWPKLRELSLASMATTANEIVNLLLRHRRTLRSLSLCDMYLTEDTWEEVWFRIGGKLPRLRKVRLHEYFYSLGDTEFEFHGTGEDPGVEAVIKSRIENQILHGGDVPDEYEPYSGDEEDEEPDQHEAKYVAPGHIEDVDAGDTSDGSAASYGTDEFDVMM